MLVVGSQDVEGVGRDGAAVVGRCRDMGSVSGGEDEVEGGGGGGRLGSEHHRDEVVDEVGHGVLDEWVAESQVGVGVALDEPDPEVFVHHEVEAEEFVSPWFSLEEVLFGREEGVDADVGHPLDQVSLQVELPLQLRVQSVDVLFQGLQVHAVALFVLAVGAVMLLQTDVGEVDELVGHVLVVVDLGGGAQVAGGTLEDVSLGSGGHQETDVEFAAVPEQGPFQVLLDHPLGATVPLLEEVQDVLQVREYLDALPLVGIRWL